MMKWFLLVLFIFLFAAVSLAAGCSKLHPKEIILDDPNQIYRVKVNDIISVTLEENITTGYSWHYTTDPNILKLIQDTTTGPNNNMLGSSSQHVWKFLAIQKGETNLDFKYYRPWEGEDKAVKTYNYQLKVY